MSTALPYFPRLKGQWQGTNAGIQVSEEQVRGPHAGVLPTRKTELR